MTRYRRLLPALVALGLAGPAWAAGGTVAVRPTTADGDYLPTLGAYADAVGQALAAKGFTLLPDPDHASMVADVVVAQAEVGTGLAKAPTGKAQVIGTGVAVPLGTGKSDLVPMLRTQVAVRLHRRGMAAVAWSGAAVTIRAAGPRAGTAATAADLAQAALAPYPAQVKEVVGVP